MYPGRSAKSQVCPQLDVAEKRNMHAIQTPLEPMQTFCYAPELPIEGYRTGATPEAGRPDWEAVLAADWPEWAVLGLLWGEV